MHSFTCKSIITLGLSVSLAGLHYPLHAQSLPGAGVQLEQQKLHDPSRKSIQDIPETEPLRSKEKHTPGSDVRIFVKSYELQGNLTVFTETELLDEISNYTGKLLTLAELSAVADILSEFYRSRGYFLAKAFLPAQDVTEGHIIIRIEEGRLEPTDDGVQIIKDNDARLKQDRAELTIKNAIPTESALHQESLERAILLLRDLPGLNASAYMEKGSETGTTRIQAEITEGPVFNPWVGVDNAGSRLTGETRIKAGADFNDWQGNGEQFSVYATQSLGSGDLIFIRGSYYQPIGYTGLKAGASYYYLSYENGKELKSSGTEGDATNFSLDFRYPLYLTRKTRLDTRGLLDFKRLEDRALGITINKKSVDVLRVGFNASHADQFLLGGYTTGQLMFHIGELDLELPVVKAADQSSFGPDTDGTFNKATFHVRRIQRNFPDFYLIADIAGQYASGNLDDSEKFQLGGPTGIRAYPSGEGLGDHAIRASLEAHYVMSGATQLGDLRLIGFYDWGRIHQFKDDDNLILSTPNKYSLSGYGIGVDIGKPGEIDFNLYWARRDGKNPGRSPVTGRDNDGSNEKNRFWVSLTLHF